MPKKKDLIQKLFHRPEPANFTVKELDKLMRYCNCLRIEGGRGSGIGYYHISTKRIIKFDQPHPGNELYRYQIKMLKQYLTDIKEV